MTRRAIDGAEKEDCVVGVDWVMSEMEETDFDTFGQKKEFGYEGFDLRSGVALVEQFLSIFRNNIGGDQPDKFTKRPAVDDFLVWTERIGRPVGGQDHIAVQDGAQHRQSESDDVICFNRCRNLAFSASKSTPVRRFSSARALARETKARVSGRNRF